MKKRSLITILLIVVISMTGAKAFAHDIEVANADGTTIYYNWMHTSAGRELEVSRNKYSGDVVIPESVTYNGNDYKVTAVGENAFRDCSGLISVSIPNSVTTIEGSAFQGCSDLISVNIPDGVTSIGMYTFYDCSSLTSINIPDNVTTIGKDAFANCRSFTSITIPNSVTTIGEEAFAGCRGLTSITIPKRVTTIGNFAFKNCISVTSINVLCSPSKIGYTIFENCDKIEEVFFECKNVTSILNGLKTSKYKSLKITLKEGVGAISSWAFSGLTNLSCITIPNSVTTIGERAFDDCSGLTSVIIPNSVTSVGNYAFANCNNLLSVIIGNKVPTIYNGTFYGCSSLTSLTIGSNVNNIANNSFSDINLIKVIWLTDTPPSGYENIKGKINYVVNDQYSLLSNTVKYEFLRSLFEMDGVKYVPVSLSERICDAIDCVYDESAADTKITSSVNYENETMNVRLIKPYLAYNNKHVNSLTIDDDCEIPTCAFTNCTEIQSATLGDNITSIEGSAFRNCVSLENIVLGNNITSIEGSAFRNCVSLENIVIPDAVKLIGEYAFDNCSKLVSVTIGNGTTSIGEYAFNNCESLVSAVMGDGGGTINDYAFNGCSSLKDLTIGSGVREIKKYAFQNCKELSQIIIPKLVTSIENNVFSGCSGLKNVIIADREEKLTLGRNGSSSLFCDCPLDSVYIGGDIGYNTSFSYGYSPFYRNTYLRVVKIANNETEISEKEFLGCTNLQRVIIGDGVASIGSYAFSGCTSLTSINIPGSVTEIGQYAFYGCNSLNYMIVGVTPPVVYDNTFLDSSYKKATLYVPKGNKAAYQATDAWKDFKKIVESPNPDVNQDGEENVLDVVDIARFVVGNPSQSFIEYIADINNDGSVNLGDAVVLINDIAGDQNFARALISPDITGNDMLMLKDKDGNFSLCLNNERKYTAFQFDLYIPENADVSKMMLNAQRNQKHQLLYNKVEEGHYRIVALSTSSNEFNGNEGELLIIATNGVSGDEVSVRNILFFDVKGNDYLFDDIEGSNTTSIENIEHSTLDIEQPIYNAAGQRLNKMQKGVNIVGVKKVIVK